MPEIALYRKYRPTNFDEVVGQDHIIEALKGAIKNNKTSHAYLFSGSRGIGKTSIARILARELKISDNDLFEIDGASNTGVDDVRELREAVWSLPFDSAMKAYLIDEVHMLSKSAFNALLKTLEEPPAHVIFMLATTEMHKIPDTIISRCEVHTLKRPSDEVLAGVVEKISKKEKFNLDSGAARTIAFLGDGSFRDTIGILQKVLSASADKKITSVEVEKITGAPSLWLVFNFILSIMDSDPAGGLSITNKSAEENRDFKIFAKLVLREIRLAMLLKFAPAMEKELLEGMGQEEKDFLNDLKNRANSHILPAVLKEMISAYEMIGYAYLPQLPIELALIKLTGGEKESK